jgi:hypothetical protein
MTYQLFKTYLIVCCSILSSPSNVWAFQPTTGHHAVVPLSSAQETRKNHATIIDTNTNRSPMILVPSKSTLYYKNLDEHEEEQQQEVPQIQQDQYTPSSSSSMETTTANVDQTKTLTNNVDQNAVTTTTAAAAPRTMDLPKSFFIKTNKAQNEKLFMSFEMYIGRIAMAVGICLLTQEVLTGSSLLDQLQQF